MPKSYKFSKLLNFKDSASSRRTGHKVHFPDYQLDENTLIPLCYKENKRGNTLISVNEVGLSEMARLFMRPNSTPPTHLVTNEDGSITGVASVNIQLSIAKEEDITRSKFVSLDFSKEKKSYEFSDKEVDNVKEIPFKFLDKLPQGFFAYLMEQKNKGQLTVDMDFLASMLVGKYALQEDDLHKGNVGIYVTRNDQGKPHVTFFNVDHDLMMSGSVMSFLDARLPNWDYGETAFNITARDLEEFPDLQDSKNHYWPTRKRLMVKYGDDKIYANAREREAYKSLKHDKEFKRYKWKRFLKHLLIPDSLMQSAMGVHLDANNPKEAANINLITQAMADRIVELRAVLLSMPEFREYVTSETGLKDIESLKQEITAYINEIVPSDKNRQKELIEEVTQQVESCLYCCQGDNLIQSGDTPLQVAIRLGQYRFDQTVKSFGQHLSTHNGSKQKPIDIAMEMARNYDLGSEKINPGKDPFAVIQHLHSQGEKITDDFADFLKKKKIDINTYRFPSRYYNDKVTSYADMKALIFKIGNDNNLSLKTKKIITVNVVKEHLAVLKPADLKKFKEELNGGGAGKTIAPEFLFISQLRSKLWFVRVLRGLYGNSSTKMELNKLLSMHMKHERSPMFFKSEVQEIKKEGINSLVNPHKLRS